MYSAFPCYKAFLVLCCSPALTPCNPSPRHQATPLLSCQRIDFSTSPPWNSPNIHVSHDHTQIPHQAASLICLEILF